MDTVNHRFLGRRNHHNFVICGANSFDYNSLIPHSLILQDASFGGKGTSPSYWSPYAAEVLLLFSSHKTSGCAGRRPPRHGIPHPGFYRVSELALAIRTALPCDMASKYPLKRRDSSVS